MNKELIFILQQIRHLIRRSQYNDSCLKLHWGMNEFKCGAGSAKQCSLCPIGRNAPTKYSEQLIFSIEVSDEPRVDTNS